MSEQVTYRLERHTYVRLTTLGTLFAPNGKEFCHTLEDVVRAFGIKDKDYTAIPEGKYRMIVNKSQRFGRDMVLLYNQDNFELHAEGVEFSGIRVHGGNTHNNTSGCILVAKNKVDDETIQGTMEAPFTKAVQAHIKAGFEVYIEIINKPQAA